MAWTTEGIKRRLGLDAGDSREKGAPALLTGSATDPRTGFVAALSSRAEFDARDNPLKVTIDYLRHVPYATSHRQNLITFETQPVKGKPGEVEPKKIRIQSFTVFDVERGDSLDDPNLHLRVNRLIGAVNALNTRLRNREPVEDTAKVILKDLRLDEVTGENIIMRGLSPSGGFAPLYMPGIFAKAANASGAANPAPLVFRDVTFDDVKTIVGFPINTLEPHNNHATDRKVSVTDPDTGVGFMSGVRVRETKNRLSVEMYIEPEDIPPGLDPKAVPNLLKFSFRRKGRDAAELEEAQFMGQKVQPNDMDKILRMIGIAQEANLSFAKRKYPAYMDSAAEFDLLSLVDPLKPPPPLEKGGQMLYTSLHGSGTEKKVENFGDQIGIAAVFLHRGAKKDGSVSTAGVAVDFPFASGGVGSGVDGAVPDYLPFWKHIDHFFITHGHFDHDGGLPYYIRKGLMKGKTIHAEEREIYKIQNSLGEIPRSQWPKFEAVSGEGATPVRDTEGNTRFWVQHYANATQHSAPCTPYIVTGCVNDDHYNGSVLVYGDSRGLKGQARPFFEEGPRRLPRFAAAQGMTVSPGKVDRNITTALHDVTAVREKGSSTPVAEVEANQAQLINNLFADKGIVYVPISTNHLEYVSALKAAATGDAPRNITAVGRNAELALTSLNIHGVDLGLDADLSKKRLDPHEEGARGVKGLIPADVLEYYFRYLEAKKGLPGEMDLRGPREDWDPEETKKYDKAAARLFQGHIKDYWAGLGQGVPGRSTRAYMLESLMKHDAVTFDNDVNGYLMWKAIEAGREWAPARATRGSATARDFRNSPGNHLIFTTGTQGNIEERFATLQKFIDGFSLLDVDEKVRPTGYKISPKDYVIVIPQSPIPGNEAAQRRMIDELVRARDVTVVAAFRDGFTIHNPKGMRGELMEKMRVLGWKTEADAGGNIAVSRAIHLNGHGRERDVEGIAKTIRADIHAAHHIPDADSIIQFNDLMDRLNLPRAKEKPDDFKVMEIDAARKKPEDKFRAVAQLNASYILVSMVRKYGQFFGGFLEWTRVTQLKREGQGRDDGLHAGSASDGAFKRMSARVDWGHMTNPREYGHTAAYNRRARRTGPADGNLRAPRAPRSRQMLNHYPPGRKSA